jgi:acetyl-CoA carboxylase carboxyl transferase subunit alpha
MAVDFEKDLLKIEEKISELTKLDGEGNSHFATEIAELQRKADVAMKKAYSSLTPWQVVQIARHPERPLIRDYIATICSDFESLHGDRCFGDDKSMIGGFATIGDRQVMLIGMDKGKTVEEKIECNFGMASPEGYRKALRLMKLAETFSLPIVCLIDTPAAYPGKEAEERGQAEAIARNLTEMASLGTPVIVIITGEGGSGGALGIAVGDVVLMLSYSVYSVIPPEGCAAILWRDAEKAPEAAEALRITSKDLLELGVIDEIVKEPIGGAHRFPAEAMANVQAAILKHLEKLEGLSARKLTDKRYERFARIGRPKKK